MSSQFCGHKACEKCAYKLRTFANQQRRVARSSHLSSSFNPSEMQKTCRMGRVCRICDRKFFLRASYTSYANELEFYSTQKQQLQHTKETSEAKLQTLAKDIVHVEKLIQTEAVNYIEKDSAKRLEVEMLTLEKDRIERDKVLMS